MKSIYLCTLSKYLGRSWAIKLTSDNNFILNSTVPAIKYDHLQIPLPSKESKLNPLTIDIRDHLKESWLFRDFYIPPNVNISIDKSLLHLEHDDFDFKIAIRLTNLSSGGGQDYFNISFSCFYKAKFNFPETNFELYEEYHQWALSIKEIIKRNCDNDSYLENNQYRLLNSINEKLDKMMNS